MSVLVIVFIIFILVLLLFGTLYYGKKNNNALILHYRSTLLVTLLYNLNLILYVITIEMDINKLFIRIIPVLTIFFFRNLYVEFYRGIEKTEKNSVEIIFVRVVPYIFVFLFSIDFIRLITNSELVETTNITIINSFNIYISFAVILYQMLILADLIRLNIGFALSVHGELRRAFRSNSLIFLFVVLTTFLVLLQNQIESNLMYSGFVYVFIAYTLILNYVSKSEIITDIEDEINGDIKKLPKEAAVKIYKIKKNKRELDGLTGLYSQDFLFKKLKTYDNYNESLSVVVISIKGLKLINESFGYDSGDEILQEISIVLSEVFGDSVVARINGGNFAVILDGASVEEIDDKIDIVRQSCSSRDGFFISLSFGKYTRFASKLTGEDVLLRAKEDLYLSKHVDAEKIQFQIADILYKNLGKRLPVLSSHLGRCAKMCEEFGKYIGLSEKEVSNLKNSALIHDIALTIMPTIVEYNIEFKDEFEKKVYKSHVTKGFDIAIEAGIDTNIAKIILHHHENYDGSGYPYGLKGDRIPYLSQIVSIIDLVDMVINYSKKIQELELILKEKSNVVFSEELVYTMIAFLKDHNIIT